MVELYPIFFAAVVLLVLSGLEILFFALLNRRWWRKYWLKIGSLALPAGGLLGLVIWGTGIFMLNKVIILIGATLSALTLIIILSLLVSLPIAGLFNAVHDFMERRSHPRIATVSRREEEIPRRRFLKAAAVTAPLVAIGSSASGVADSFGDIRVYKIQVPIDNLPPELAGLRILHVSDIHIGYYVWLDKVADVLERAKSFQPDLILATGDLCDRLSVYPDVLQLLDQFRAPLGVYASLGNHEYYRGIRDVLRIYEKGPVPLLINRGVTIKRGGREIYIAGADDPRMLRGDPMRFLQQSIDKAMDEAPQNQYSILMSHRPRGLVHAAELGATLVLAGHTHGGQLGLGSRSVFDAVLEEQYLWGLYRRKNTVLYTSSGMGHWFPFRLGCPAEAPILELVRG